VLVGHSFGGTEAIALAAQRPERVGGLVLTNSVFPPARGGRSYAATAWDYARHRALYLRELADRGRAPRPSRTKAGQLSKLARQAVRPGSFHAVADEVRCPVLVIHGVDDHVVTGRLRARHGRRPPRVDVRGGARGARRPPRSPAGVGRCRRSVAGDRVVCLTPNLHG
jgi:pimeloyl-ACP methyl ester carboxylesterase